MCNGVSDFFFDTNTQTHEIKIEKKVTQDTHRDRVKIKIENKLFKK